MKIRNGDSAAEQLQAAGFGEVVVWLLAGNRAARSFYERCGFVVEAGVTRTFERQGARLPEVRYRGRLGGHSGSDPAEL